MCNANYLILLCKYGFFLSMFNYGVAELQNNGTTFFFKTTSQRDH